MRRDWETWPLVQICRRVLVESSVCIQNYNVSDELSGCMRKGNLPRAHDGHATRPSTESFVFGNWKHKDG